MAVKLVPEYESFCFLNTIQNYRRHHLKTDNMKLNMRR